VSVPIGRSSEGLPLGVQVVGRRFEDDTVLGVAEWLIDQAGPTTIADPRVTSSVLPRR
jgi:Asp-tRNA(Asn)/Glu-tRNA(Gln) amidotransferase A subunit family amidase